jgi:hypothetical protein
MLGMAFNNEQIDPARPMMKSREFARAVMAAAASSLFAPESPGPDVIPQFRVGPG